MPDLKLFSLKLLYNTALVEPPQHEPSYHREEHYDQAGGTENEVVDQFKVVATSVVAWRGDGFPLGLPHKPFLSSTSL